MGQCAAFPAERNADGPQYKGFIKDCPGGQLNKEGMYQRFSPQTCVDIPRRVSEDLPPVLPLWRPIPVRRLRLQRV